MDFVIILALLLIVVVLLTNNQEVKESFSTLEQEFSTRWNSAKEYTNIPDAHKGIAAGRDFFYVINTNSISKHSTKTGELIKRVDFSNHPRIKNMNGAVVVRNNLYVTNSPATVKHRQNTIEVFNRDLVYLYHINVTGNTGALTWIDYHNGKWWGCFAHYDDMVRYTVLVEFYHPNPDLEYEDTIHSKDLVNWHVKDRWFFPHKVNEHFLPYSCTGGSFGPDGKLYVTGHRNEIYVLDFHPKAEIMGLDYIKETDINVSVSIDKERGILFGINKDNKTVHILY